MDRDELRAKIFAAKKLKKETVELFGEKVEIRQPTLQDVLATQQEENRAEGVVRLLMNYCYVPDTDIRVFEAADKDSLMSLPFDESLTNVSQAFNKLMGIDVQDASGN